MKGIGYLPNADTGQSSRECGGSGMQPQCALDAAGTRGQGVGKARSNGEAPLTQQRGQGKATAEAGETYSPEKAAGPGTWPMAEEQVTSSPSPAERDPEEYMLQPLSPPHFTPPNSCWYLPLAPARRRGSLVIQPIHGSTG